MNNHSGHLPSGHGSERKKIRYWYDFSEVSSAIDLGNEFSDLGLKANSGIAKGLLFAGKVNSFVGIISEFSSAYDRCYNIGLQFGEQKINSRKGQDFIRARWVLDVVNQSINSGLIKGDENYFEEFYNFALDGNPSGIEVDPNSGLTFANPSKLSRLQLGFEKVLKMVENMGGEYIEVESNNQLDRQYNI